MAALILLAFLIAICITVVLAILWSRARSDAEVARANLAAAVVARDDLSKRLQEAEAALSDSQPKLQEAAAQATRIDLLSGQTAELDRELQAAQDRLAAASQQLAEQRQTNALMQKDIDSAIQKEKEVTTLLNDAKEEMAKAFELVANEVLGKKSRSLTDQNKEMLGTVLGPFNQNLKDFKDKVEAIQNEDIRERSSLNTKIDQLTNLNNTLSAQAQSLTDALRGQAKVRGNWGEAILSRVLEASGLRDGHEFRSQVSHPLEDGRRLQPDVVVDLPQERFVIIDSKLSLVAYERYVVAEDDEARAAALRSHVASIQSHINDLAKKDYARLYGLKTLDFVLMFVPIEPALMLALQAAPELAESALTRRISLVSPNTLYTALRTIDYIWRVDRTSKSVEQIKKLGGLLYDSAVLFAESMVSIGTSLQDATGAYEQARSRLIDSQTGVLKRAERLKALRIKSQKAMPPSLQEELEDDSAISENGRTLSLDASADGTAGSGDPDAGAAPDIEDR
ncbi:MAG: DNA recombination protein RmuC [Rhodanobacteraceae bacterium]